MARRVFILVLPLVLLAALEVAYRLGAWEPLAAPESHSGQSIRMKRAWRAKPDPIETVTLGSSRAVYGLDHALLAREAERRGSRHGSFALAGSHWMSVRAISRWLEENRPDVRQRWIALSITDFQFPGNGSYELGIVEPLRSFGDAGWIRDHVRFDPHDVATYGVYSSLLEYRADMADAIRHPWARARALAGAPPARVFDGPLRDGTTCGVDTSSLERCSAAPAGLVADQCRAVRGTRLGERKLLSVGPGGTPHPDVLAARDLIVAELRRERWRGRTVVILMPTHDLWARELSIDGLHGWVLSQLEPLAREGVIELLDYTTFFDRHGASDCRAYFDLYHQNRAAATVLTHEILERRADRRRRSPGP